MTIKPLENTYQLLTLAHRNLSEWSIDGTPSYTGHKAVEHFCCPNYVFCRQCENIIFNEDKIQDV